MRSSKDRTIEKKRKNKAMKVSKTEKSRKRRIANGHKRDAIHAINPDLKITIIDGVTHTDDGINGNVAVEIIDGKIRAVKLDDEIIKATMEFCNEPAEIEDNVIANIKTKNKTALQRLALRFKKDKVAL